MSPLDEVRLVVDRTAFGGWEEVEITRSMQALCGSFSLTVSGKAARGPFPVQVGALCELYVGSDLYLTGYVDRVRAKLASGEHQITVEGRDLAQDMVDCSPADLASEYYDIGLLELAQKLADPFGIAVRIQEEPVGLAGVLEQLLRGGWEGARFYRFSLQCGETAFESLDRACRMRGFLALSDARGTVLITRAGLERAGTLIAEGSQLKSATYTRDDSCRFSRYFGFGQQPGSDLISGADAAESRGEAFDPVPRARRTMVLNIEANVDDETAQERTTWEANVRAARSRNLQVVLNGWRQAWESGQVWRPNLLVPVSIPTHGVFGDYLTDGVRLALNKSEGQVTELALAPPGAFLPEPPKPEISDDEFTLEEGDAP